MMTTKLSRRQIIIFDFVYYFGWPIVAIVAAGIACAVIANVDLSKHEETIKWILNNTDTIYNVATVGGFIFGFIAVCHVLRELMIPLIAALLVFFFTSCGYGCEIGAVTGAITMAIISIDFLY